MLENLANANDTDSKTKRQNMANTYWKEKRLVMLIATTAPTKLPKPLANKVIDSLYFN